MPSPITTHVLDTANGCPAQGIPVTLDYFYKDEWQILAEGTTNTDGRITDLLADTHELTPGNYRLTFYTGNYHSHPKGFYPYVPVVFQVQYPQAHYHIPLLLSPFSYTTYRGS